MFYAIVGVLAIILDQWVKYWTAGNLVYGGEAKVLIPGLINLVNVHNDGAAFSFLSGANAGGLFIILALAFAVLVIIGLITNFISGNLARWSAVMVAAGGIGNAIDRALYQYVQDMIQFAFLDTFPVFNVADIYITVFCIIFIICIIFGDKKPKAASDTIEYEEELPEDFRPRRSRKAKAEAEYEEEPRPARRASRDEIEYEEEPRTSRRAPRDEEAAPAEFRRRTGAQEQQEAPLRRRQNEAYEEAENEVRRAPARRTTEESRNDERFAARQRGPAVSEDSYSAREAASVRQAQPAQQDYAAQTSQPAVKSAPVKSSSSDFDLDDILNEFK